MTPRQVLKGLYPPPPRRPKPPPEDANERAIREGVDRMAAALAYQDDSNRQAAVRHAVASLLPPTLERVVDRLGDMLDASYESNRRCILATLVEFGPRALPSLTLRLMRGRNAESQRGVVEALWVMVPRLDARRRIDLMADMTPMMHFARDASVRRGLAELTAALRLANERDAARK